MRINQLDRRLQKLEVSHKSVLRCLWCRVYLTDTTPEDVQKYQASPMSVLLSKCWYCGNPYTLKLGRASARHKEAADLAYNSHPVKVLSDERLHTAAIYLRLSTSYRKRYLALKELARRRDEAGVAVRNRAAAYQANIARQASLRLDAKGRKAKQEQDDLKARADAFVLKKQEEFKRRAGRNGEPFEIDKTLAMIGAHTYHSFDTAIKDRAKEIGLEESRQPFYNFTQRLAEIRNTTIELRKREACELVIWGNVSPETLSEIAFFEAEETALADEALEAMRAEKEKAAKEAEERRLADEEWRAKRAREQGGGSGQRLTPRADHAQVIVAPIIPAESPFWNEVGGDVIDGTADETENPIDQLRARLNMSRTNLPDGNGEKKWSPMADLLPDPSKHNPTPQAPPDRGNDPYYQYKLAHFKKHGVWPDDRMLAVILARPKTQ
jgi:hypothetical protein